jgi:hypothetical protein
VRLDECKYRRDWVTSENESGYGCDGLCDGLCDEMLYGGTCYGYGYDDGIRCDYGADGSIRE